MPERHAFSRRRKQIGWKRYINAGVQQRHSRENSSQTSKLAAMQLDSQIAIKLERHMHAI